MPPLLEVKSIHAGYGDHQVLHGLSLSVELGENVGLFGPNGHGKTTLFETISGVIKPTSGSIYFNGENITGASPKKVVELGLIHASQGNRLFSAMKVGEVLSLGAYARRAAKSKESNLRLVRKLFPRLSERHYQTCGTLSGGERQMLNVAVALMACPSLLILDEPTLGLSPKLKDELADAIEKIAVEGLPLLLVEQDIDFLLRLTSRLYLINHGEVTRTVAVGDKGFGHSQVMEEYFGITGAGHG